MLFGLRRWLGTHQRLLLTMHFIRGRGFLETMAVHVIGFGTSPPACTLKTLDTSGLLAFLI
jgi:hypothetical protein